MGFKNYYYILGIDSRATQKDINTAYRIMAKKWHPDKNNGVDTTAQMQLISEAYEVLKNREKREAYDVEYRKYLAKSREQSSQRITIEKCYYCGQNIANPKFAYSKTLYRETKRRNFAIQRKVWYETLNIKIPRCEGCNKIHESGSLIFIILPLIAFSLLGLILGLTLENMWLFFLIAGGFVGLILGNILSSIDDSIIANESGIKKESDISGFKLIAILRKKGWTTTKPEA